MRSVELVIDAQAPSGEGPIWDAREEVVRWVDYVEHLVHSTDPATGRDRAIDVGQPVGSIVPRDSGRARRQD